MGQLDTNFELTIFRKVYGQDLAIVEADLIERSNKLKWIYEKGNLTEESIKRANTEEARIKNLATFLLTTQNLINLLENELMNKHQDQILWHEEWMREAENGRQLTEIMIKKLKALKK